MEKLTTSSPVRNVQLQIEAKRTQNFHPRGLLGTSGASIVGSRTWGMRGREGGQRAIYQSKDPRRSIPEIAGHIVSTLSASGRRGSSDRSRTKCEADAKLLLSSHPCMAARSNADRGSSERRASVSGVLPSHACALPSPRTTSPPCALPAPSLRPPCGRQETCNANLVCNSPYSISPCR